MTTIQMPTIPLDKALAWIAWRDTSQSLDFELPTAEETADLDKFRAWNERRLDREDRIADAALQLAQAISEGRIVASGREYLKGTAGGIDRPFPGGRRAVDVDGTWQIASVPLELGTVSDGELWIETQPIKGFNAETRKYFHVHFETRAIENIWPPRTPRQKSQTLVFILTEIMKDNLADPLSKKDAKIQAEHKSGRTISDTLFKKVWPSAIKAAGATEWKKAGPRRRRYVPL